MLNQPKQDGKVLIVSMDYHAPRFEFHGLWSGKDVHTVQALIRREYFKHTRLIRREQAITKPTQEEVKV